MQNNFRKSLKNTLASPICEIKSNLGTIAHFIVKETHRLHNSITCHRKIDIELLSIFHHSAPADNRA